MQHATRRRYLFPTLTPHQSAGTLISQTSQRSRYLSRFSTLSVIEPCFLLDLGAAFVATAVIGLPLLITALITAQKAALAHDIEGDIGDGAFSL